MATRGLSPDDPAWDWQLQEAKAQLSKVVKAARESGPQHITVRGQRAVVLISEEEFARLTSSRRSIVDHILSGPAWPDDVVDAINERSTDAGRDISF